MTTRPLALTLFLAALMPAQAALAELRVVTTTSDLAAIAKAVGGDRVEVTALSLHTQDPHFVDARPHLTLALARADLLLQVGLELEVGWLPTLQTGSRNARIQRGAPGHLDCSQLVARLEVPTGRVDRSMGDVHPGGSPHYLMDPRRAEKVAAGVAERMAKLDAGLAAHYRAGAARFAKALRSARGGWEKRLAKLRGKPVIAYHRSFAYLADWLGLRVVAHVEPKPGVSPNPRHIAHVLMLTRSQGVRAILQESYYPANASRALAERSSAQLVIIPGGPDMRRGESYLDFVAALVGRLETLP
ncbi:MAG: zinc ABC transporter substrate-binding protein [Myxococcales bacterium]|nr:zinc ABC transporter substrate-binding protein [Myxococcales bacterium]